MYYDVLALSRIFINVIDRYYSEIIKPLNNPYIIYRNILVNSNGLCNISFWIIASECAANTHKGCH